MNLAQTQTFPIIPNAEVNSLLYDEISCERVLI